MLQPKQTKYRKQFRGRMRGKASSGYQVTNGDYGLKTLEAAWITAQQIEAARKAIVRETKRKGKVWLKIFPDKSYTKKPSEVRMGKGKGDVAGYVAVVKPGRIMFEMGGVDDKIAIAALRKAGMKLPVKTEIVEKELL
jgi:large subunit ribosomal protein L16